MTTKPRFVFRGTAEQQAQFIAGLRALWELDDSVDLTLNHAWARWYIPLRINGRRIYWEAARKVDAYPWGLLTPRMNGWNPKITQPSELRTWLAIPDGELRDVNRANLGPARPLRSVMIGLAIAAFLLASMWLVSLRSTSAAGAGVVVVVLGTSKLVLGAFGVRLNRASSFDSYRQRQRVG